MKDGLSRVKDDFSHCDPTALTDYLDRRLGGHDGQYPEYQWACPFCIDRRGDESSKRKLRVNVEKGVVICFRCEYAARNLMRMFRAMNGGKLYLAELALLRHAVQAAVPIRQLTARVWESIRGDVRQRGEVAPLRSVPLPGECVPMVRWASAVFRKPVTYMTQGRGMSLDEVACAGERYEIGYCPTGMYSQRLIFPVRMGGEVVYHTNRFCGDHPAKSLNPPNVSGCFSRQNVLLGFDQCVGQELVALVEGPFDMLAFPSAVAMLGKSLSPSQIVLCEILAEMGTREFVVALDADADPSRIVAALSGRVPAVSVLPLDYGDPWDRRNDLPDLLEARGSLGVEGRVRRILLGRK
jgi:hypothetical protein